MQLALGRCIGRVVPKYLATIIGAPLKEQLGRVYTEGFCLEVYPRIYLIKFPKMAAGMPQRRHVGKLYLVDSRVYPKGF